MEKLVKQVWYLLKMQLHFKKDPFDQIHIHINMFVIFPVPSGFKGKMSS